MEEPAACLPLPHGPWALTTICDFQDNMSAMIVLLPGAKKANPDKIPPSEETEEQKSERLARERTFERGLVPEPRTLDTAFSPLFPGAPHPLIPLVVLSSFPDHLHPRAGAEVAEEVKKAPQVPSDAPPAAAGGLMNMMRMAQNRDDEDSSSDEDEDGKGGARARCLCCKFLWAESWPQPASLSPPESMQGDQQRRTSEAGGDEEDLRTSV